MDHRLLEHHARAQHGLVTKAQSHTAGMSRSAWYRALDAGRLIDVRPGVARLPGAQPTPHQVVLGEVLWRGEGARASHRSAAMVWGAPVTGVRPVDVTVPPGRAAYRDDRLVVHRLRAEGVDRPMTWRSVPVTNPIRTLLDLGAVDASAVAPSLRSFVTSGYVRPSTLLAVLDRHGRPGRHGVTALRAALAAWDFGDRPPDSELEVTMNRLLRTHRLPPATFHARILGIEVDFHVDDSPVVVECDGWDHHGTDREQFERDRDRDAVLIAGGYVVLRFTWTAIVKRPAVVAERITSTLRRHAPHLLCGL